MSAVAFIAALVVGVTIGLLGAGGSILTVPIMIYLLGLAPKSAMTMSLIVVGLASASAVILHSREKNVSLRVALPFAAASAPAAFVAGLLSRSIPDAILVGAFAVLIVGAAVRMLTQQEVEGARVHRRGAAAVLRVAAHGIGVGGVTGLLGAGGGFVIVPALTTLMGLPMRRAIGTSLLVVFVNAVVGFAARATAEGVQVPLAALFSALSIVGAFTGHRLSRRLPAHMLRHVFAGLLIAVALMMISRAFSGA